MGLWGNLASLRGLGPCDPGSNPGSPSFFYLEVREMIMTSPDWNSEFKEADRLIRKTYSIDYTMPKFKIISEADYRSKFMPAESMKDIMRPSPIMAYDDNIIFVIKENNALNYPVPRIFVFSHEIAHAITTQLNKELSIENIVDMMYNKDRKIRETGVTLFSFDEGIADYIAVHACACSTNPELIEDVLDIDRMHEESFEEFRHTNEKLFNFAHKLEDDNNDWPHILARSHKHNDGYTIQANPYVFGYNFVKNHQNMDVKELIMNPPRTYAELTIPEAYDSYKFKKNHI